MIEKSQSCDVVTKPSGKVDSRRSTIVTLEYCRYDKKNMVSERENHTFDCETTLRRYEKVDEV